MLSFVKTEALGNDFILVAEDDAPPEAPELARNICDRRGGVGADGLILWKAGPENVRLRIFNMDGSEAECSGNGLRCVAAYFFRSRSVPGDTIRLETISGVYPHRRVGDRYAADMGRPALAPPEIPFLPPEPMDRVIDFPLDAGARTVRITACSTGNPHCSLFVDDLDPEMIGTLGPLLERHPAFPHRTNVEFIRVQDRENIEVRFWERGVGNSPASGTGSCGATVASILNGRTERAVTVHAEQGTLEVEWGENGRLTLTATARVVAEGRYWSA